MIDFTTLCTKRRVSLGSGPLSDWTRVESFQTVASGAAEAKRGSCGVGKEGGLRGGTFAGGSRDGSPPLKDDRTRSVSATGELALE